MEFFSGMRPKDAVRYLFLTVAVVAFVVGPESALISYLLGFGVLLAFVEAGLFWREGKMPLVVLWLVAAVSGLAYMVVFF